MYMYYEIPDGVGLVFAIIVDIIFVNKINELLLDKNEDEVRLEEVNCCCTFIVALI